jgi:hypothetical protein
MVFSSYTEPTLDLVVIGDQEAITDHVRFGGEYSRARGAGRAQGRMARFKRLASIEMAHRS